MLRRKLVALMIGASLVAVPSVHATQFSVGGQVPLIAEVLGMGFASLDLSVNGTGVKVGQLIVSCNAPSFTVDFTLANSGAFNQVGGAGTIDITAFLANAPGGGTLGTGAAACNNVNIDNATSQWAAGAQTTATIDYLIDLNATWAADPDNLAGFYREKVTVTISPTL